MNKIGKMLLLLAVVFLISGCGKEETLTCSITQDLDGMVMLNKSILDFTGTKITKADMIIEVKLEDEYYLENKEEIAESFKKEYSGLDNKKGVTYNYNLVEDTVIISIAIDYDNLDLKEFENEKSAIKEIVSDKDKIVSITVTKSEMEEQGYSCDIK